LCGSSTARHTIARVVYGTRVSIIAVADVAGVDASSDGVRFVETRDTHTHDTEVSVQKEVRTIGGILISDTISDAITEVAVRAGISIAAVGSISCGIVDAPSKDIHVQVAGIADSSHTVSCGSRCSLTVVVRNGARHAHARSIHARVVVRTRYAVCAAFSVQHCHVDTSIGVGAHVEWCAQASHTAVQTDGHGVAVVIVRDANTATCAVAVGGRVARDVGSGSASNRAIDSGLEQTTRSGVGCDVGVVADGDVAVVWRELVAVIVYVRDPAHSRIAHVVRTCDIVRTG